MKSGMCWKSIASRRAAYGHEKRKIGRHGARNGDARKLPAGRAHGNEASKRYVPSGISGGQRGVICWTETLTHSAKKTSCRTIAYISAAHHLFHMQESTAVSCIRGHTLCAHIVSVVSVVCSGCHRVNSTWRHRADGVTRRCCAFAARAQLAT